MKKFKNATKKTFSKIAAITTTMCGMILGFSPLSVFASASDYSFLENGTTNAQIDQVTNDVKAIGASGYRLVMAIAVAGTIISLILAFAFIGINKSGQKREENKSWVFWILISIAGVCGALSIYSFIQGFVS